MPGNEATYRMIVDNSEVQALCAAAAQAGSISLDTEFLWERTYAPLLCLVQVNVAGTIQLIDPLDGIDLSPLMDVIADPAIEIVMHAPHADLVGCAVRWNCDPANIFDTQIAAGFVGHGTGLAYDRLVEIITGKTPAPSESFSDWSRRPLNDKQLRYAAEDVLWLPEVAAAIKKELRERSREEWATEEMEKRYGDPGRFRTDPNEAWRKVSRRGKLSRRDLAALQPLAAWRERKARDRDIPASWVLKDPTLCEIAKRRPSSERSLASIRGVKGVVGDADKREVLRVVGEAPTKIDLGEESAAPPGRGTRRRVSASKGLGTALLRARCELAEIALELVRNAPDVEALITWVASQQESRAGNETETDGADETAPDDPDTLPTLLGGWRAEVGREIVDLVEGRISLSLTDQEPWLVVNRIAQDQ